MLNKASVRFLQIIDGITEKSNKKQTKRSDGYCRKLVISNRKIYSLTVIYTHFYFNCHSSMQDAFARVRTRPKAKRSH